MSFLRLSVLAALAASRSHVIEPVLACAHAAQGRHDHSRVLSACQHRPFTLLRIVFQQVHFNVMQVHGVHPRFDGDICTDSHPSTAADQATSPKQLLVHQDLRAPSQHTIQGSLQLPRHLQAQA